MTQSITQVLSAPITLPCGVVIENRIAKSAMSECLAQEDFNPSIELIKLYERFAKGNAGLLITGNVIVSREGIGEPGNVIMHENAMLERYRQWAAAATSGGNHCFMQLNHAGRQSPKWVNEHPVAPSALPVGVKVPGLFVVPRELTIEDIERLTVLFGRAAQVAKESGFTGVQLHGAHGYLISQFLSPLSNRRSDKFGGSLDNRMRFLIECYRTVRRNCGAEYPVSLKLNSADFLRGGFTIDESIIVARTMAEEGIDLLEISGGTYEKPEMFLSPRESFTEREAHFLEYARLIRKEVRIPLMLTGGLRTPSVMSKIITDGSVDIIGLARPIAIEPDFPRQVLAGRMESSISPKRAAYFKFLAAAVDGGWYQQQLHRMAKGLEPEASISAFSTLCTSFRNFVQKGKKIKKESLRGYY